jgi:uncharacterized DUF497 family protein
MKFEFDPKKSTSNKAKHGIDFVEAQALWKGPGIELHSKNPDEPWLLVIGKTRRSSGRRLLPADTAQSE